MKDEQSNNTKLWMQANSRKLKPEVMQIRVRRSVLLIERASQGIITVTQQPHTTVEVLALEHTATSVNLPKLMRHGGINPGRLQSDVC